MNKVSVFRREHFNAAHRLFNPKWDDAKNFEVFGRGRAYALEYCSHEAPTGALRLRQYNWGSAANNAAEGTDSSLPSQS